MLGYLPLVAAEGLVHSAKLWEKRLAAQPDGPSEAGTGQRDRR